MTANNGSSGRDWIDPDEIPDLTGPEWADAIAKAEVKRGRPKAAVTKVSTTIRLDPDVLKGFRATGPGWQSRINETLKDALRRGTVKKGTR